MPTITKELENTICFHARQGYEDILLSLAKRTYDSAIEHDNSMHVGSVDDDNIQASCEQTCKLINIAKGMGITDSDWLVWHVIISPVQQLPVIFIEIKFDKLMSHSRMCKTYRFEDIDEGDILVCEPANGTLTHTLSEPPVGNIVGSYIQCVFEYNDLELPLLIQFDNHERVSAESSWEYQVVGMGEKIDLVKIALNLRLLKHAGDRMNLIDGSELLIAIQSYYTALFHRYEAAQQDANRYTKATRGVYVGDPETEQLLRNRLRNINKDKPQDSEAIVVNFPEPDNGFTQNVDWMYD